MNKKGFTLIELIIVMAIISILSYIIMPSIASSLQIGHNSADESNLQVLNSTTMFLRTTMKGNDPFEDPDKSSEELMSVLVSKKLLPNKLQPMAAGKKFAWFRDEQKWDYSDATFEDSDDDDDVVVVDPPVDEEPPTDEEPPVSGTQAWKSGVEYELGAEVLYNGARFKALKDTSSTPNTMNSGWQEITSEYRFYNLYNIGDRVFYDDKEYESRSSANHMKEPGLIDSPWQEITTEWRSFNVYEKNDEVYYNGKWYIAIKGVNPSTEVDPSPANNKLWRVKKK